jgi:hypothetical protein
MPLDLGGLISDLAAETASLRTLTGPLPDSSFALETAAPGWSIADTLGHLAYFDDAAVRSATSPGAFRAAVAAAGDVDPDAIVRRYRHIGARAYSFAANGRPMPTTPVRVELDDGRWTWGPADAPDRIAGPSLDFALLITQRRHRADTALTVTGPAAGEWMDIAQAFAGPPGGGRAPRSLS